ncbi:hypothetical protein MMC16_006334 [Acarospora aff. strigata]|nr:hypothetical protein [Acarospora aff. strigata]
MSKHDIALLTRILSHPPSPSPTPHPSSSSSSSRSLLRDQIHSLPPHLLRPYPSPNPLKSLFTRPSSPTASGPSPNHPALCPTHARLNAPLLHSILHAVQIEVGTRLNRLACPAAGTGPSLRLSPAQMEVVRRLRALHALWLDGRTYRALFLVGSASAEPSASLFPCSFVDADSSVDFEPEPEPKFPQHVRSRPSHSPTTTTAAYCSACMLSRIGASIKTVLALRVVLISRRRKGRPVPRLMRWVDGWLDVRADAEALKRISDGEGRALREVRKRARRGGGREDGRKEKVVGRSGCGEVREDQEVGDSASDSDGDGDGDGDGDFENEIIDCYARADEGDLRFAGRDGRLERSLTDVDASLDGVRRSRRLDGVSSGERRRRGRLIEDAEEQAKDYRALLGSRI